MKDLDHIDPRDRARITRVLSHATREALSRGELDVVPLVNTLPWRRLRIGTYRVLFRPATAQDALPAANFLVGRIVHRRDLERAAESLK